MFGCWFCLLVIWVCLFCFFGVVFIGILLRSLLRLLALFTVVCIFVVVGVVLCVFVVLC